MIRRSLLMILLSSVPVTGIAACGNSDDDGTTQSPDASAGAGDASAHADAADSSRSSDASADAAADSGASTTIAAARQAGVTTPITVTAIVTALHGTIPNDVSEWYVEDLAGGPSSGVVVYCDPDKSSCPTAIRAPSRGTVVQISGSLETYQGQVELIPTAQTVVTASGTLPPIPTVTAADLAPSGTSMYRGVLVKLASGTTLTVDDVTPAALHDSSCTKVVAPDGGAATGDAGVLSCSYLCSPPAYSGFTANDGKGDEVNVEATFFATDPLQSSPECLGQPGVVPVTKGMTFSALEGVLDYDGYAKQQQISPVLPSDYTTP